MGEAFRELFKPFALPGELIALQELGVEVPTKFFRVVSVEPIPEVLITIAASAAEERQQDLEAQEGRLLQWRYRVVTALAQVVLRSPRGARSFGTGGGGQGFVSTNTETDWGTIIDRALTEFFHLGGNRTEVRFDNLAATAATDTRFAGWKHYLSSEEVREWTMQDPVNASQLRSVDPHAVVPSQIHLLQNFAGIVPLFLTRG